MNKNGRWALAIGIVSILILVVVAFLYFALFNPRNERIYEGQAGKIITNPAAGLSLEQAISQFNESFVSYLLYSIKAYNLHNPPLSNNEPKMQIFVGDDIYNAKVIDGGIYVYMGEIDKKDITMRTTKDEAVKMMQSKEYIKQSFASEKSSIELNENKATLFAKGYLNLYKELTGKSITGSVIRIYAD